MVRRISVAQIFIRGGMKICHDFKDTASVSQRLICVEWWGQRGVSLEALNIKSPKLDLSEVTNEFGFDFVEDVFPRECLKLGQSILGGIHGGFYDGSGMSMGAKEGFHATVTVDELVHRFQVNRLEVRAACSMFGKLKTKESTKLVVDVCVVAQDEIGDSLVGVGASAKKVGRDVGRMQRTQDVLCNGYVCFNVCGTSLQDSSAESMEGWAISRHSGCSEKDLSTLCMN